MRTRSKGLPLEPLDLEIEATNRRRRTQRRTTLDRVVQVRNLFERMEHPNGHGGILNTNGNVRNNNAPPPSPPNHEQIILQLQQQMEQMRKEREDERRREAPVRNTFSNVAIPAPPIGTRVDANTFELMTGLIQMVEQHAFAGRPMGDPNKHLSKFVEISNTTKLNGVPDETINLRLFLFSLSGYAKDWYDNLAPGSVATWNDLAH